MTFDIKKVNYYSWSICSNFDDEEMETDLYYQLIDDLESITDYGNKRRVSDILKSEWVENRHRKLFNVAEQLKKEVEKLGIDCSKLYIER